VVSRFLSLLNAIRHIWRERHVARVALSTAIPTIGAELGPRYVCVTVTNVGLRAVTIEYIGIRMPSGHHFPGGLQPGKRFGLQDTWLPARLSDGDLAKAYFPYRGIGEQLRERLPLHKSVRLTPTCKDSAGGEHSGKPWKVTPSDWR
jgi:hypothetical protein